MSTMIYILVGGAALYWLFMMGGIDQIKGAVGNVTGQSQVGGNSISVGTGGINVPGVAHVGFDGINVNPSGLNVNIPTISGLTGNSPMGITNMNNNVSSITNTGPGNHSRRIVQVNGKTLVDESNMGRLLSYN